MPSSQSLRIIHTVHARQCLTSVRAGDGSRALFCMSQLVEREIIFPETIEDHSWSWKGTGTNKWFEGLLMEGKKYQLRGRIHNHLIHKRWETAMVRDSSGQPQAGDKDLLSGDGRPLPEIFRCSHGLLSYR